VTLRKLVGGTDREGGVELARFGLVGRIERIERLLVVGSNRLLWVKRSLRVERLSVVEALWL
jgi:hypothetical protein